MGTRVGREMGRWVRHTANRSALSLRWVTVALLLVTSLLATGRVTAQAEGQYQGMADGLEWSVRWDTSDWEETGTGDAADLVLTGGASTVSFLADVLYGGDASDCVDGELANAIGTSSVEDSQPLEESDIDLGERDGDGRAWAGYALTSLDENGDEQTFATTVLCQTITDGESVLIVYHLVPLADLPDDADAVADLVAGIVIGEGDGPEPTAEPDDEVGIGADEDAGTYVSPSYGYSLSWDPGDWVVETDETIRSLDRDRLELFATDGSTQVFYEGSTEWDGDLDACVDGLIDEVVTDANSDDPIELATGTTVSEITEIDDPLTGDAFASGDGVASAGYSFNLAFEDGTDQDQFVIVDCVVLDEETGLLLGVSQIGLADDLGEDVRLRVVDVTETVRYAGE